MRVTVNGQPYETGVATLANDSESSSSSNQNGDLLSFTSGSFSPQYFKLENYVSFIFSLCF